MFVFQAKGGRLEAKSYRSARSEQAQKLPPPIVASATVTAVNTVSILSFGFGEDLSYSLFFANGQSESRESIAKNSVTSTTMPPYHRSHDEPITEHLYPVQHLKATAFVHRHGRERGLEVNVLAGFIDFLEPPPQESLTDPFAPVVGVDGHGLHV